MVVLICNPVEAENQRIKKLIRIYCKRFGIRIRILSFNNPIDAIAEVNECDIAIIETKLPDISGIGLGKVLLKKLPLIKIIFTSEDENFLDEAFDVSAVRFFQKPFSDERFIAGLTEAIKRYEDDTVLFDLKNGGSKYRINKKNIVYIETDVRKTKVVTTDGEYYSKNPIYFWREHVHSNRFLVPHNSYIINYDYISEYVRNDYVIMENGERISISRAKGADFHAMYEQLNNTPQTIKRQSLSSAAQ